MGCTAPKNAKDGKKGEEEGNGERKHSDNGSAKGKKIHGY